MALAGILTVSVSIDNTDVNLADPTGTVTLAFSETPIGFSLADVTSPDGTLSNPDRLGDDVHGDFHCKRRHRGQRSHHRCSWRYLRYDADAQSQGSQAARNRSR